MPDVYVNPVTGFDGVGRGDIANPYRTLSYAVGQLPMTGVPGPGMLLGTIHAAAGIYQPPDENFPIIVPPGYDLVGAGSALTEVRFTGEVRTATGTSTTYWGGDAIYAGRHVRGLTLRANPAPSYSCYGMRGIRCQNDGSNIEDVLITLDTAAAPPPDFYGLYDISFSTSLEGMAIEITLLDCRFEHASRTGAGLEDCTGVILRCEFDGADLRVNGVSNVTVDACTAENYTTVNAGAGVAIQNCTFGQRQVPARGVLNPSLWIGGSGSRLGPANSINVHVLSVSTGCEAFDNDINVTSEFFVHGAAHIRDNQISAVYGAHRMMSVNPFGTRSGTPVIERNVFTAGERPGSVTGISVTPIEIGGSADFGGGASAGGNDFGLLFLDRYITQSQIKIDTRDDPGAVIRFDGNLWDDPDQVVRRYLPHRPDAMYRFEVATPPPAVLTIDNRMRSSRTP